MRHARNWRWAAVVAAIVAAAVGCTRPQPQEARGRVTFQGQPVPEGIVVVDNEAEGISLTSPLQPDGSFVVTSYQGRNLPAGTYRLAVRPPLPGGQSLSEITQPAKRDYPNIPEKYRDPKTSGLTAEVRAGVNEIVIDMQPNTK